MIIFLTIYVEITYILEVELNNTTNTANYFY